MKKQTNNKNRQEKLKKNKHYNSRKNKQNIKNKKSNKIKLNKSKNKESRKELLAKFRRNDSSKLPKDLSFCFIGKLAKKNRGFGFIEPIEDKLLKELRKRYNTNFNLFHEDIFVKREMSLGANNEDIVLVRIIDEKRHYEGKVIKILQRNTNNVIGIYEIGNNKNNLKDISFGFVKPIDKTFSTDIYIKYKDSLNAKNGDAVLVEITKYPEKEKKTEGKIIRIITNNKDPLLSLKIILAENNIQEEFPNKVKKELDLIPNEVIEQDLKYRKNYSNLRTYTIDR